MVKFCERRFAQSELMVYKNFEKNYKIYRTTWSGDMDAVEPEPDATAIAAAAIAATTSEATAAEAAAQIAAAAAAAAA